MTSSALIFPADKPLTMPISMNGHGPLLNFTGQLAMQLTTQHFWKIGGKNDPFFGWSRTVHSQKRASRSYMHTNGLSIDSTTRTAILHALIEDADIIVNRTAPKSISG